MEEESNIQEIKEGFEKLEGVSWNRYLAITTAFIAVTAAIATLQSGNFANKALLEKNDAVLFQSKASDQYAYYQAKGIKKNLAEGLYIETKDRKFQEDAQRYKSEQEEIKKQADEYVGQVNESNAKSTEFLERHHKAAIAVTFFQISIALSAMSALLRRKLFWLFSILLLAAGLVALVWAFV